jgi:hypothetical protein
MVAVHISPLPVSTLLGSPPAPVSIVVDLSELSRVVVDRVAGLAASIQGSHTQQPPSAGS